MKPTNLASEMDGGENGQQQSSKSSIKTPASTGGAHHGIFPRPTADTFFVIDLQCTYLSIDSSMKL